MRRSGKGCRWDNFRRVVRIVIIRSEASGDMRGTGITLLFCFLGLILRFFSHGVFLGYLNDRLLKLGAATRGLLKFLGLTRLNVKNTMTCGLCGPLCGKSQCTVGTVISVRN